MNRTLAIELGVLAVAVGGAFALGRFSAPDRVELRDRVVYQDRIVTKVETAKATEGKAHVDTAKDVRTVYITRWLPGGGVEQTATTEDKTKAASRSEQKASEHETKAEDRIVYREHETLKLVERKRPAWTVAAMPGVDLRHLDRGGLQLGVAVEHRLFGPVLVGAWGSTTVAAGLSVRVEF